MIISSSKEGDLYNRLLNKLFEQEEPPEEESDEPSQDEPDESDDPSADAEEEAKDKPDDDDASDKPDDDPAPVEDATSLDADIEAVFIDFETSAREEAVQEGLSLKHLYENADELSIDTFAADVARLVKNYDNLLDIETLLVGKAKEFIEKRYGKDAAEKLESALDDTHNITAQEVPDTPPESNLEVPLAVGATASE